MRWVKSPVLPIALISTVVGGYYLTASDRIEAVRDANVDEQVETPVSSSTQGLRAEPKKTLATELGRSSALEKEQPSAHAQLTLLRKELAELRKTQARFQQALDDLMNRDRNIDDGDFELSELDDEAVAQSKTVDLEHSFESETIDPAWGSYAEIDIQSTLAERSPAGLYVSNAQCRNTICRIDVEFDDARSRLEGMQFLPMLVPWSGESFIQIDPNGDRDAVLYAAREGYALFGDSAEVQ